MYIDIVSLEMYINRFNRKGSVYEVSYSDGFEIVIDIDLINVLDIDNRYKEVFINTLNLINRMKVKY